MELDLRDADVASKFDAGLQAHNAGDLNTAEKLYQQALSIQPDHCEANHNIGVVFAAKNELDKALKFFKYALDSSPNVSLFWASYIDALIKLERISESKTLIKAVRDAGISCEKIEAISQRLEIKHQEPGDKDSQELDELIRQEKFDEAIQKCLSLMETYPSSAALNINLGKCYFEQSEIERAISSYKKAIEYQPQWATSYILLGHLYSSREQSDQAIEYLKKAINLQPDNPELYAAIGAELLQKDKTQEAIQYLEKATKLNPKDETSHFNLGNALQNEGSLTPAIASYQKAITINPHNAEAYLNTGAAFQSIGDKATAVRNFEHANKLDPDNLSIRHTLDALTGQQISSPPNKYVEDLFDNYASKFDNSLITKLKYKVPKLIANLLLQYQTGSSLGSIMDLGCGTGLAGVSLKNICKSIQGIDLSKKMLTKAKQKNVYDKLNHIGVVEYLSEAPLDFDLFVSADVFVYVGELSEIFRLIKSRNKRSGLFTFTTEHTEKNGFFLETSGRYSHSKGYIESLCQEFNYELLSFSKFKLRKHQGMLVTGGLYLLKF